MRIHDRLDKMEHELDLFTLLEQANAIKDKATLSNIMYQAIVAQVNAIEPAVYRAAVQAVQEQYGEKYEAFAARLEAKEVQS